MENVPHELSCGTAIHRPKTDSVNSKHRLASICRRGTKLAGTQTKITYLPRETFENIYSYQRHLQTINRINAAAQKHVDA